MNCTLVTKLRFGNAYREAPASQKFNQEKDLL